MEDAVNHGEALPAIIEEVAAGRGLMPAPLAKLQEVADLLASSGPMVPHAFQGSPERCLAVAYQAARWGLDPVAVAQKSYITKDKAGNERIAYEAQLIAALINTKAPIRGPVEISYSGEGPQRFCVVSAMLEGARSASVYTSPRLVNIKPKNSPLWYSDPDQQLAYYSQRAWARKFCPQVILGVYTPEELVTITDVTERPVDDPYNDPPAGPLPEVEGELVTEAELEPSGGAGYVNSGAQKPEDNGRHPNEPEPSGGAAHSNNDGAQREAARDLGPNPWPDVGDILEWAEVMRQEMEAPTTTEALIRRWEQAKAHGMLARLKRQDQTVAKAMGKLMDERVAELRKEEENAKEAAGEGA